MFRLPPTFPPLSRLLLEQLRWPYRVCFTLALSEGTDLQREEKVRGAESKAETRAHIYICLNLDSNESRTGRS